ncbi:IPT/TIG domain-containing protein [Xanthomonas theicola]|uniref:IPT/TIG domain-containing protein n=1 Tax=Xanthomonas theicola TaxID=56464 RepID=UPI0036216BF2
MTECARTGVGRDLPKGRRKATGFRTRFIVWILCVLAAAFVGPAPATDYVHDADGRLIAVTNDAGESARYVYDVVGNIVQVERIAAGELALFSFTPRRGTSGTQVRLRGHGFNTDPADNVVRFGGVVASVASASSSDLVAVVPPGAVTGPVSVTVGAQSVSSTDAFIVDESALAPRIDRVSPLVATTGASVTVTGKSLYPLRHQTTVAIGTRSSPIGSAQDAALSFVVPPTAASGKVSVTTPYGMATSAQDLVVLPSGIDAADVTSTARVAADAPASRFSVRATGKQVAVLVDAALGEYFDAQFSAISVASLAYTVYDPFNRKVTSGTVTPSSPSLLLPPADRAGTYLLLIEPVQGPATWNLSIERSKPIVADGDSSPVITAIGDQKKRLLFSALRDQRLGLGVSGITLSTGTWMSVAVLSGDGTSVASTTCHISYAGCQLNIRAPQAGTYSVVFTPGTSGQVFQLQATLSNDVYAGLQREKPLDLVLPRRGQNARLAFTAQAGDALALQVLAQTTQPAGTYATYAVYKPDGTLLTSSYLSAYKLLNLPHLPQSGEYVVFADPDHGAMMHARIILMDGSGNGTQIDGDQGQFTTPSGGQSVYFNFDVGEVGQRLGLGISALTLSSGSHAYVYVYRPDGTGLASAACYQSDDGCDLDIRAPVAGRYSVIVEPASGSQTMQFKATLSNDLRADIAREASLQLAIARRGQNAQLYFDAQAGETLALQVAAQATVPAARSVRYQVHKPDGSVLVEGSSTGFQTFLLPTLAATGRHHVFVDPEQGETMEARVTLSDGRQTALAVDGEPVHFVAPISGHPAYLTFVATKLGQSLGLAIGDIELSAGTYLQASVYRPDGTLEASEICYQSYGSCDFDIRSTMVGTYGIVVTPQNASQLARFTATLSNDLRGVLQREVPAELAVPRRGQNARMTFTAQAGENLALQISGQSTVPSGRGVVYTLYRPDGRLLTSSSVDTHDDLRLMNLPASGEYLLFVDPGYGATMQARVLLTAGNAGAPVIDGAHGSFSTTVGGQATFTTFAVTEVDQRIGVGISDLVLSSGSYVLVQVYRPDGSSVVSATCYQSNQGCDLNLRAPQAGTYGIVVTPLDATQTMKYKVGVSNDLRMALPRETSFKLDVPRRGQNARLSFAAQAGQSLALQIAGQTTLPAGNSVGYAVYKPDGALLAIGSTTHYTTLNMPTLPASGEYMVFVDPGYGSTVTSQLVLTAGSGTVVDGDAGELSTAQPGQSAYLTFQATAGQLLGLGISALSVSSGTYVSVYAYRPDGSSADSTACMIYNDGCALNIRAATAGTYSVVVTPQSASQTMRFKATLSQDLIASLERDVPLDLAISRRGQNARLSFSGQAGEWLSLQIAGQATVPAARTLYYRIYRPDGALLTSTSTANYDAISLPSLPSSGRYTVLVDPGQGETGRVRLTLASGSSTLQVDGASAQVATDFGGQSAFLTFQAKANQRLGIGLDDLRTSAGSYFSAVAYGPDGYVASTSCHPRSGGCEMDIAATVAGTYRLYVTPQTADQTIAFKATLSTDRAATLRRNARLQLELPRQGQNGWLSFNGEAGKGVTLQISGQSTIPSGGSIYYMLYKPDGSALTGLSATAAHAWELPPLPVSGEYHVSVSPAYGAPASVGLTLQ